MKTLLVILFIVVPSGTFASDSCPASSRVCTTMEFSVTHECLGGGSGTCTQTEIILGLYLDGVLINTYSNNEDNRKQIKLDLKKLVRKGTCISLEN